MGLATIDPHGQKKHTEIHKSPSLVLIGLVLTDIQAFKNVKNCPVFHTFLCKFFTKKCKRREKTNCCAQLTESLEEVTGAPSYLSFYMDAVQPCGFGNSARIGHMQEP